MQAKICGTTSVEDARLARDAGADFVGAIVRHAPSPRNVSVDTARAIRNETPEKFVLLTVNQDEATLRDLAHQLEPVVLQLHGDETPELVASLSKRGFRVWKAIYGDAFRLSEQARVFTDAGAQAVLVDARETSESGTIYGGSGKCADWSGARALVQAGFRVVLAGGLNPENVARAVKFVSPWAIDCVSGLEASKGVKDAGKVRSFVDAAKMVSN